MGPLPGEPAISVHDDDNPVKSNGGHRVANVAPQQQREKNNGNASSHPSRKSVVSAAVPRTGISHRQASVISGIDSKKVAMMYDIFLNIRTDNDDIKSLKRPVNDLVAEFREYRVKNCNLSLTIIVTMILSVYFAFGIYATAETFGEPTSNPFMTVFVSFSIICLVLFIVTAVHRFFIITDYNHPYAQPLKRIFMKMNQSAVTMRLMNDSLPVFLALRTGFKMLGRVLMGPCDSTRQGSSTRLFDCSTDTGAQGIPPETYVFCLYVVLLPQMFIKGASRVAICASW